MCEIVTKVKESGLAKGTKTEPCQCSNRFPPTSSALRKDTIGAALHVHRVLGPGFLERVYQQALCIELQVRGIAFERERPVIVSYRGVAIPGQRIDLIIEACLVVELKAAPRFATASYDGQVISYLRTTGLRLGLLLNFGCPTLKEGIRPIDRRLCVFVQAVFLLFVSLCGECSWCLCG
jgi:GxxExxY protein